MNVVKTRKVLVVEDSRLIHKMYEVMLRPCMLIAAHDGREGLARLAEHRDVDVIILDINMPHMTGLEFLGQVKQNPDFVAIPVVIVSTEGKEEDVARGLKAGAVAYLKKPFQREDLLKIIGRLTSSPPPLSAHPMKEGEVMAGVPLKPGYAGTDATDPLATLMRARQLIHDAQAAIDEASRSVVQQRTASGEIPEREARLAQVENDRDELAARVVEVEHQVGRLMTLYVATYQLHATLDPADVQSTIAEITVNLLGAEAFALLLRDEDADLLEIPMQVGEIAAPWSGASSYTGGDPLIDASLIDGMLRFGPVDHSPVLVVVPLRVQDVTVGALVITKLFEHKGKLDEEDRELLDLLGAHAASALFASRVYARAARKLRTLEGLIKLVKKG